MRKSLLFLKICIFIMLPVCLFGQTKTVSGKVSDAKGNPIANVSVIVKQTGQGATTDAEGKFKIAVPADAQLLISSSGFKSQTVKVADNSAELGIKLEED